MTDAETQVSPETTERMTPEALKPIIAANVTELRRARGMTQLDLAQRLNYTDKAISKWERGESIPDVTVLKNIADLFGVTVDYLLSATHEPPPVPEEPVPPPPRINRTYGFVTGMSILIVWLVAIVVFMVFDNITHDLSTHWIVFLYAVPASLILWLILNSIWFNRRWNYLIISLLMWTTLLTVFLSVACFADRLIWIMFLLGLPGQAIIIMWSRLKHGGEK